MKFKIGEFVRQVYQKAMEEDIGSNAAQVAFYFIFALFPLLLFVLSIIGLVLGSAEGIRSQLFLYLHEVIPDSALRIIIDSVNEVMQSGSGGKLTFGILLALWSASAGIDGLRVALNDIYDLTETRPWWKHKLTSLLLTLAISILIFLALGVVFYGSQFINLLLSPLGLNIESGYILGFFSFVVVAAALVLSFALLYSVAPNHKEFTWTWITPGAVVAIVLWLIFSFSFRVYLYYFDSYAKTYGSVGAIIILLLWLYLTGLVILIGGVVNSVGEELSVNKPIEKEKSEAETEAQKDNS
jgi:membrane protein